MQISNNSWIKLYWMIVKCIDLYSWCYMTLLFNITETFWTQQMNHFEDQIIWQNRMRNITKMLRNFMNQASSNFNQCQNVLIQVQSVSWHSNRLTIYCLLLSISLQLSCLRQISNTVVTLEKQISKQKIWFKFCHYK